MSHVTPRKKIRWKYAFYLIVCTSLLLATSAQAKDYKVEVLIFKHLNSSQATESHRYQPLRKMPSRSSTWSLPPSLLKNQSDAISHSESYDLMHHFAWGQESLRYRDSATYTVAQRDVRGAIKVYADSLLFVNLELDYDGYRMNEKRRLKLNEKHFFDHPKFGVLLQVSRLEKPKEVEVDDKEIESKQTEKEEPSVNLERSR